MPRRTTTERLEAEQKKLEIQKNRVKELKAKERSENAAKERKARNHRFMIIGGEIEKQLQRPLTDEDVAKFVAFIQKQDERGRFFTDWMNR